MFLKCRSAVGDWENGDMIVGDMSFYQLPTDFTGHNSDVMCGGSEGVTHRW